MPLAKNKAKLIASSSAYIDPLNCDSTIQYKIINGVRRVWGSMQIADCARKVEWYFGNDHPIEKLDRAIAVMQEFRDELNAALILRRKRTRTVVRKVK